MNIKTFILAFVNICFFTGACQLSLVAMENEKSTTTSESQKNVKIVYSQINSALEVFLQKYKNNVVSNENEINEFKKNIQIIKESNSAKENPNVFYFAILCTFSEASFENNIVLAKLFSDDNFLEVISINEILDYAKKTDPSLIDDFLQYDKIKQLCKEEVVDSDCSSGDEKDLIFDIGEKDMITDENESDLD